MPWRREWYPLQYSSCLENSMARGAWWTTRIWKSWTDWATNTFIVLQPTCDVSQGMFHVHLKGIYPFSWESCAGVCSNGVLYAHLLLWELQNYNSLLNNHQQKNVGFRQKNIPHTQGQRKSPSKMVGGAILHLESYLISARDAQRAQTNLVWTRTRRPHRDWARTVFECLLQRYRWAVGCCKGRGSGCSRPEYGISPLGGGLSLTPQ